jgi:hypothetical protein
VRLFRRIQEKVRNKLTKRQYQRERSELIDVDVARAGRHSGQRLSVAVHIASAWEIATEMQLAGGGGEAPSSDEKGAATA